MKNTVLYVEKDFANRVFAIENRFEKMGANLLLINNNDDNERYLGTLYRDVNLLSGIFKHYNDMSANLYETIDYYLSVYFGYLEIISYIIEYRSLYNIDPAFVIGDDRLFSSYNKVVSLMDGKKTIASKFFNNLTIMMENLAECYGYSGELYKKGDNLTQETVDESEHAKIKVYPTLI